MIEILKYVSHQRFENLTKPIALHQKEQSPKNYQNMSGNRWSNKFSFIITTSAFAIGLGNVWRFPYVAGEGGGAAFLLVYLILVLLVGIPLLTIEIALGRMSKTTILLGFGKLGAKPFWNTIGWLGAISCILNYGFLCYDYGMDWRISLGKFVRRN